MRSTLILLFVTLLCSWTTAQTARLQVIHNSPTPTVDVYANQDLLLDNFAFRTATPFIDVPAEIEINLGIALANSSSADDAIANFPVTLMDGGTYVVVAGGVVGGAQPFNLFVFDMGMETVAAENVGILFFHGSPDAPRVDIIAGGAPIFDDVSFGEFSGYLEVPAASYDLGVTPADDNATVLASYQANLDFWRGRTAVVFASGFLGGGMPAFEPWVALDNGGTFPLPAINTPPPPPPTPMGARIQIIHNSPTPTVDVWVNEDRLLDNFVFRTATPFVDVPADVELTIGIALSDSDEASDALVQFSVTLEEGATYVAIANGIVGGNPGFNLEIFDMGEETADSPDNVGLLFFHGSPDAPEVDIIAGGAPIFDDVSFGEFSGYLNVPADSYELGVTPAADNTNVLASYQANLGFWRGRTAVVFASGFLNGDAPGFEPWVALDNGGTFPLGQTSNLVVDEDNQIMAFNQDATSVSFQAYPNPAVNYTNLSISGTKERAVNVSIFSMSGELLKYESLGNIDTGTYNFNIDLSMLESGMYFMQIENGRTIRTERLTVMR